MSLEPNPRRNDYVGDGSTSIYDYDFPISDKSELVLKTLDTSYNEVTLVLDTDYSVQGEGDEDGGTITLLLADLPLNYDLAILGRKPVEQQTNINNQGSFRPDIIERALDSLTKVDQEQQEQLGRTVMIPEVLSDWDGTLPVEIADPANDQKGLIIDFATKKVILGDPGAASASAAQVSAAQSAASQASADAAAAAAAASAAAAALSAAAIAPIVVEIDTTAGNVPYTLPSAAANAQTFYYLVNTGFTSGFDIQVARTAPDLIHNQTTDTVSSGMTGKYYSNGTDWLSLN